MTIVITIDTDNAAFKWHGFGHETARILDDLCLILKDMGAKEAEQNGPIKLYDTNGNTVGQCSFA